MVYMICYMVLLTNLDENNPPDEDEGHYDIYIIVYMICYMVLLTDLDENNPPDEDEGQGRADEGPPRLTQRHEERRVRSAPPRHRLAT